MDEKKQADRTYAMNVALTAVVGQVGCVTVLIIVLALFAGLWIDNRFGTSPWFTVGLLLGSMPLTVVLMLRIVKAATSRMVMDKPKSESPSKEEDVGTQD